MVLERLAIGESKFKRVTKINQMFISCIRTIFVSISFLKIRNDTFIDSWIEDINTLADSLGNRLSWAMLLKMMKQFSMNVASRKIESDILTCLLICIWKILSALAWSDQNGECKANESTQMNCQHTELLPPHWQELKISRLSKPF